MLIISHRILRTLVKMLAYFSSVIILIGLSILLFDTNNTELIYQKDKHSDSTLVLTVLEIFITAILFFWAYILKKTSEHLESNNPKLRIYSMVNCLFFPFGTILGTLTLIQSSSSKVTLNK